MKISKKNILDIFLVIIIFACTGLSAVYASDFVMGLLGFEAWSAGYILGYIFIIFPLYQLMLLGFAFLFGRFSYFFERQKKMIFGIKKLFVKIFSS